MLRIFARLIFKFSYHNLKLNARLFCKKIYTILNKKARIFCEFFETNYDKKDTHKNNLFTDYALINTPK